MLIYSRRLGQRAWAHWTTSGTIRLRAGRCALTASPAHLIGLVVGLVMLIGPGTTYRLLVPERQGVIMLENASIDDAVVVDGDVVTVDIARLVVMLKSSGQNLDKILWDHETLGLRQLVSKIIHERLKVERGLPVAPPVVFRFEGGKFRRPETDAEIVSRARLGSPRMSEFVPKGA